MAVSGFAPVEIAKLLLRLSGDRQIGRFSDLLEMIAGSVVITLELADEEADCFFASLARICSHQYSLLVVCVVPHSLSLDTLLLNNTALLEGSEEIMSLLEQPDGRSLLLLSNGLCKGTTCPIYTILTMQRIQHT